MDIEKRLAEYKAKLLAEQAKKANERAPYIEAAKIFLDAVKDAKGETARELAPVVGRLNAFINGEKYFTRNRGGKD